MESSPSRIYKCFHTLILVVLVAVVVVVTVCRPEKQTPTHTHKHTYASAKLLWIFQNLHVLMLGAAFHIIFGYIWHVLNLNVFKFTRENVLSRSPFPSHSLSRLLCSNLFMFVWSINKLYNIQYKI